MSANNWLKLKNFLDAYHAKRVAFYEFASTYYGNDQLAGVKSQLESSSGKSMLKLNALLDNDKSLWTWFNQKVGTEEEEVKGKGSLFQAKKEHLQSKGIFVSYTPGRCEFEVFFLR